jgi:hypothetical protein
MRLNPSVVQDEVRKRIMDLLRDPLWQFIGAILAFLGVTAAILIYFMQRQKKQLSFRTITNVSLVTVRDEASPRITVAYDGKPVSNVRLFEIVLANTGNIPIASTDYERPLSIRFLEHAKILSTEIVEQTPANLGVTISHDDTQVIIAPILMNRGDSSRLKAIVTDSIGEYQPDARIVGVSRLSPMVDRKRVFEVAMLASGILLGMGSSLASVSFAAEGLQLKTIWRVALLLGGGITIGVITLLKQFRTDKQSRITQSSER